MASSQQNPNLYKEEEVTMKDLIIKTGEWWRYLWKKKFIIILFGILGAGLGVTYSYIKDPVYIGELTFVMEDSKGGGTLGAYAGLASQFGIDLGGLGGSSGAFSGDNLLELLKSRLLIEKTLLEGTIDVNGKPTTLAEWYISFNELRKNWKDKPALENLHYNYGEDRSKFTLVKDSMLNVIQTNIIKQNLKVEKTDKKLSFIGVTCTSINEAFSKRFVETLVDVATDFYIETKTKRNKTNIDRLQGQADSIEAVLNRRTYKAAVAQDLNPNPARQIASVGVELAMRDKLASQTMYAEIMKNLELSKIAMEQETPIIQIVDRPILPLEKKKFGRLKGIVFGGAIGGFLIAMYFILRKIYKDIMA